MHAHHHFVPDFGRQAPAGNAGQRGVVVIAHPDTGHVIGRIPYEPGVPCGLGRAGLAGNLSVGQGGAAACALFHDLRQHVGQFLRGLFRDYPLSHAAILPHQGGIVALQAQIDKAIGFHGRAAVQDAGIGAGHVDQR